MNKTNSLITGAALLAAVCLPAALPACTGISFAAADGTQIQARTIEWGGYDLNSKLVVLPRRMGNVSYTPQGKNGLAWNNKYGAVGAGSALLGLPGDVTPPSRFVRAFFWLHSAPAAPDAYSGITQAFHILNNFDIPIGSEFAAGEKIPNLPSATQWTSAADLTHPAFYYRTMYNSQIRKVDLTKIDFDTVTYTVRPLDEVPREPMEELTF